MNPLPSPLEWYRQQLEQPDFVDDQAQAKLVSELQRLFERLSEPPISRRSLWSKLFSPRPAQTHPSGIYIWGGVGAGKSMLMDIFYHAVPGERKLRAHFHRFMQQIHAELRELHRESDPLPLIARRLSERTDLICFDEMQVHDVADAMLLGGLFTALLDQGMALVITSNREPDQLYLNGLQRERFLPVIKLLRQRLMVHHLQSAADYRYRSLQQLKRYLTPLNEPTQQLMSKAFDGAAIDRVMEQLLSINGREIPVIGQGSDVVWFSFDELCGGPRSPADYLAICEQFHTVFLSGVPKMGQDEYDLAHRFMSLVDLLYDHRVNLIVSAAAPPGELYDGDRFQFEFDRVVSRLIEMQSEAYMQACRAER